VGRGAIRERGAAREVGDVERVGGAHQPLAVVADVLEEGVVVDVLQVMGADQVAVGHAGDREHGRLIDLRVVETVQEVTAPGAAVDMQTPSRPVNFA
jgi:hypothetical protein